MSDAKDPCSDTAIIGRILEGDTNAFSVLVRRYQHRILRLGYGFFKDGDAAKDFAQDVFLKAYAGLSGFRGHSSFSTWITRIAYNTGINAKRRLDRFEPLDGDPVDGLSLGPEELHLRSEAAAALRRALADLPERFAICLELYFGGGMKYEEISHITGFPVNTIKSHVRRARQSLRDALADEM